MDYEKLIDQDFNGLFCLVFQNKGGLETEEIQDIFSEFGEVYSVKASGNKTGYYFIRYKLRDEIEKAIEGLKDHPSIKLAPHRKNKNKNNKENRNPNDQEHYKHDKDSYSKKKFNETNFYNGNKNGQTENNFQNSKDKENTLQSQPKTDYDDNLSNDGGTGSVRIECKKLTEENFVNSGNQSSNYYEIPDLIMPNGKSLSDDNVQMLEIINAEEVIVGNIHPGFGAPYILYLLDRFEPIAISNVNIIPESDIRYCHVYFKNLEDSLEVETLFDQMNLCGQRLVVQRTCRLMAGDYY